jgi:hypothetical protein
MGFKTFSDFITFTRTTNATLVDSTGRVTYAPNNLLLYSQQLDDPTWVKNVVTVSANVGVAPDGTTTADKVIPGISAVAFKELQQNFSSTLGVNYAFSCYVKDAGYRYIQLIGTAGQFGTFAINYDLQTGTETAFTAGTSTVVSRGITPAGNGWYRVSVVLTAIGTSAAARIGINVIPASDSVRGVSWASDGTSGILQWGAQVEAVTYQTLPSTYVQTVASAYYGPRFDYNPVTLAPNGLLIEEQRVNLMTYSDGTVGWSVSPGGSLVVTANAATSPAGTSNATKIATGDTLNSGHSLYKLFSGAVNTVYTGSAYLKAGEYTRAQINFENSAFANLAYGALFDLSNGTIVATTASTTATITNAGNGWYRCTVTATSDADGGNYVFVVSPKPATQTTFGATYTPVSVGLGVFLYGVQVEAGAFATSYIPTAASTVTRAADIALMTGTNFSSWYNQSEGTLVTSALPIVSSVSKYSWSFNDGTGTELIAQYFLNVNAGGFVVDNGSAQAQIEAGTFSGVCKTAFAYKINDFALSLNGGTVTTDTVGTIPTTTQAQIGNRPDGSRTMNGYIRTLTYYPSRLTNAQLQALTA